jgi:hypothetical protein
VNWAKDFVNFLPEKPLKDRSRKDVEAFLADLGKRRGIAEWQVRQAEHALRILYEIFLPHYVPEKHTVKWGNVGVKANCLFHAATSVISSGLAIRFTGVPGYPNFHTVHQGPDLWAIRWNVSLCKLLLPSNDFCK